MSPLAFAFLLACSDGADTSDTGDTAATTDTACEDGYADTWYPDEDGDGYGDPDRAIVACTRPEGALNMAGDCDDAFASVHPHAEELCNGRDDDCDELIDEDDPDLSDPETWYLDADGDGYGRPGEGVEACEAPPGYSGDDTDCDDEHAEAAPGVTEICDGLDNDCDEQIDEDQLVDAWPDDDGDGYGAEDGHLQACDVPAGHVERAEDCDDGDPLVFPGATEHCDGVQNDCSASDWTDDAGTVSLEETDGTWTSFTSTFSAGTASTLAIWTGTSPGVLRICEGTWYASLHLRADIDVQGEGEGVTVLSGGGTGTPVSLQTDTTTHTISDLTLRDGLGDTLIGIEDWSITGGCGLLCDGFITLTLERVTVTQNTGESGAGAALVYCTLDVRDSTFEDNVGDGGAGGGLFVWSPGLGSAIDGSSILGNSATWSGGGLTIDGATDIAITDTESRHNDAGWGGGLYLWAETATLSGLDLEDNTTSTDGGGGYLWTNTGPLSMEDSRVEDNVAEEVGGGLYVGGSGSYEIAGSTLETNSASSSGGVYLAQGDLDLDDVDMEGNTAELGDGISVGGNGTVDATDVDFSDHDDDVYCYTSGTSYELGTGATFTCDGETCE